MNYNPQGLIPCEIKKTNENKRKKDGFIGERDNFKYLIYALYYVFITNSFNYYQVTLKKVEFIIHLHWYVCQSNGGNV